MNINSINKCIINLPKRTDRLAQIKAELKYLFSHGDSSYHLVDGIETDPPKDGIAQAHLNCIHLAKSKQWPHVLIMEDDCVFPARERTLPYVMSALECIPDNWDVLLGGVYSSKGLTPENEYWNRTLKFSALHFYIVNQKAYDWILNYDPHYHIDGYINHNGHMNCYVASKFFAIQRIGFSDNVKKHRDYTPMLKKYQILQ